RDLTLVALLGPQRDQAAAPAKRSGQLQEVQAEDDRASADSGAAFRTAALAAFDEHCHSRRSRRFWKAQPTDLNRLLLTGWEREARRAEAEDALGRSLGGSREPRLKGAVQPLVEEDRLDFDDVAVARGIRDEQRSEGGGRPRVQKTRGWRRPERVWGEADSCGRRGCQRQPEARDRKGERGPRAQTSSACC
ncbi:MAG: hypothetical protein LC790_02965, partial [Actinobacteria bacterium]|nr:hypothetical protein [Actinomycetota bacterium]